MKKIAISGLGKMGMQIARKLAEDGFEVIAHNRSTPAIDEAVSYGAKPAHTKEEVVKAFEGEQLVLWLMVPSDVVDATLDEWLALIPKGSIIIDGGNSDFRLTKERSKKVTDQGSYMFDVGTSGGVWGYQNGFSMMAGGDKDQFKNIEKILQTLAKPTGAYHYFGESGSGHFVKMTHNAIEYGMMESLAEGYNLLKNGPYKNIDLAAAGEVWQHHSVVTSWLNELSRDILKENPELGGIEGTVAESGEARWMLEVAKDYKIPTPSIQASFDVRLDSQKGNVNFATKLLAAMRNAFGGHKINNG
jgi:6-phosphogluconate dehydrogenase